MYPANTELCGKKFTRTIIIKATNDQSNEIRAYKICAFLCDIQSICLIAIHIYSKKYSNLIVEEISSLNALNTFEEILGSNLLELSNKEIRILAYNYNKQLESKKAKLLR